MQQSPLTDRFVWTRQKLSLLLIIGALTLLCVYRVQVGNRFTVLLGDSLDGVIQDSILQHWYNFFRGIESWNSTAYFYPWSNTLGYNDGFFIQGLFYSLFRAFGADVFLSAEWTGILVRGIGFIAFTLFAADILALTFGWAVLGAAIFTLANNISVQAHHGQLLTVAFAPLLFWLIGRTIREFYAVPGHGAGIRAAVWGTLTALLYGAWLLTGFYMAWFTAFFSALVLFAAASLGAAGRWRGWRPVRVWPLIPIAAAFALSSLPFLIVYLPKARETGMHSFQNAMVFSPSLLDWLHVGSDNFLFGGFDAWLTALIRPGFDDEGEHTIGIPPVLALCAALQVVAVCKPRGQGPVLLWRALTAATIATVVLSVHVGHFTLWYWVFRHVPGAGAVRVISRIALLLTVPIILLAMKFLQQQARRWPSWVIVPIAALLVAEEFTRYAPIRLQRTEELRLLASVPLPPPACRSFYVAVPADRPSTGSPVIDSLYPHNVDGMLIAEVLGLPTINGFSTFNPPDWVFANPRDADYSARVRTYVKAHNLQAGICGLDLAQKRWLPMSP